MGIAPSSRRTAGRSDFVASRSLSVLLKPADDTETRRRVDCFICDFAKIISQFERSKSSARATQEKQQPRK